MKKYLLLITCYSLLFFSCKKQILKKNCCTDAPLTYIESNVECVLPNLFTPNGDGINDLFGPITNFGVLSYTLTISSTKKTLFEGSGNVTDGMELGFWDGKFEGATQTGIFGYEIVITTYNEEEFDFRGQVCTIPNPEDHCLSSVNTCVTASQFNGTDFDETLPTGESFCID